MRRPAGPQRRARYGIVIAAAAFALFVGGIALQALVAGVGLVPDHYSAGAFAKDRKSKAGRNKDRDDDRGDRDKRSNRDDSGGKGFKSSGGDRNDDGWSKREDGKDDRDWSRGNDTDKRSIDSAQKGKANEKSRGTTDSDDDVGANEPAGTVQEFMVRAAAPPQQRKRRARPPKVEDFNSDLGPVGRPVEIIATGLDATGLAAARSMGFKLGTAITAPSLGIAAQTLEAPGGLGRKVSQSMLQTAFPRAGFAVNQIHILHQPAEGEGAPSRDIEPGLGPRAGQCREDRCYARRTICWSSEFAQRAAGVKIGLIDTPVDLDHPVFAGHKFSVGSFHKGVRNFSRDWHGTAVLSLLAGSLDSGVPGLVPDAQFFIAEAFNSNEQGVGTTDTASLVKALEWLELQGVAIVNLSFTGPYDPIIARAIARMRERGVTFVAAAGNEGPTSGATYPAAYPEVIAVTAIDKVRANYFMANRGDFIDLSAPGVGIWMALSTGKEGYRSGTSFAAPIVTALVAATMRDIPASAGEKVRLKALPTFDIGPPGADPIFGRGLAVTDMKECEAQDDVASSPGREKSPAVQSSYEPGAGPAQFGTTTVVPVPASASAFGP